MQTRTALRAGLISVAIVSAPLAQELPVEEARNLARSRVGLSESEGKLWGLGPDYRVAFGSGSVEMTPALGAAAPRSLPLEYALESVHRRGAVESERWRFGANDADALQVEPLRVEYRHGQGVVERYDLRAEGLEQSFVLDALPTGGGDLVVRGRFDSELRPRALGDGLTEVLFEHEDIGGLRIGAITAIDADGVRYTGTFRCEESALEIVIPEAFVTEAAFPIWIDPLVSTAFGVGGSGWDDEVPDVARDADNDVFLVVWQRRFSGGDVDLRGQLLDAQGATVGGLIGLRSGTALESLRPRVANISLRDRFVVAWQERANGGPSYIAACTVNAANGSVASALQVVAGNVDFVDPDVGGDVEDLGTFAQVVYRNSTGGTVELARLSVSTSGTLARVQRRILRLESGLNSLAISRNGGRAGRYLVVWGRTPSLFSTTVAGVLLDRFGNILDTLSLDGSGLIADPEVDGDGDHWLVAYERRESTFASDRDIYCRWVTWNEITSELYLAAAQQPLEADANDDEIDPVVSYLSNSFLVALGDETGAGTYAAVLHSIQGFDCLACEGEYVLESLRGRDARSIAIGGTPGNANQLLVWETRVPSSGDGDLRAWRFRPDFTFSAPQGGGCGGGGRVHVPCAIPGNANFAVRLERAEPNRPAFFVISLGGMNLSCGPCTFQPDPFRGFAFLAGTTDAQGDLSVPMPLPFGGGVSGVVVGQFLIVPSGTPECALFGADLSDHFLMIGG